MARLAEGDRAAIVTLYVEFGAPISGVLRRHLRRVGVPGIGRDELDGLVIDACFSLAECAGAWDPAAGVAPWTWADRRLGALVAGWVGIHADGLDGVELVMPPSAPAAEADVVGLFTDLDSPLCRLLADAFDVAHVSVRDRSLLLEVRLQASLGDPSPAHTVAPVHAMRPDAVRQAVKRTRDRLRRLAHDDARFAPLADLALIA